MNARVDPSLNLSMGAMPGQNPVATRGNKLLWGSVVVLGVAVLAMGATLANLKSQNQDFMVQRTQAQAQAPTELPAVVPPAAGASASLVPGESLVTDKSVPPTVIIHNHLPPPAVAQPARPIQQAQRKAAPAQRTQVAQTVPAAPVVQAPQTAPAPSAPQVVAQAPRQRAPVVYSDYPPVAQKPSSTLGTVESVTPVQRNAKTSGLGVVAGGVLGAIVGSQIGKGSGRTLGTIVGAVGGGFAGNAVEKQMKKETVYQVGVRMDNGKLRTIEQASAPSIGSRININQASQAANTAPAAPTNQPGVGTVGSERA